MRFSLCLALLAILSACDFEASAPGTNSQCAFASDDLLCQSQVIETRAEACEKLVDCGSIPLVRPEDEENIFDYASCISLLEGMGEHRARLSIACVSSSSCDQLVFENGPNRPPRRWEQRPACLEYGRQP